MQSVPVVDYNQKPLMPTTPRKARILIKSKEATPFWNKGIFCIRLNYIPERVYKQDVVVGVDPGSRREGFTVKSEAHTFINVQTTTPDWISKKIEERRNLRRSRRYRNKPYRANRSNRATLSKKGRIPPSTKARWQWKLRMLDWLSKMYPITTVVVEDIKVTTRKGSWKWNKSFSPLEVGKQWMYSEVRKRWRLITYSGYETYEERQVLNLKKSGSKLSDNFNSHCIDSWCLANMWIGGHVKPDNKNMIYIYPLKLHRRNLHRQNPSRDGIRKPYGGTNSKGFKRGSWVRHIAGRGKSYGVCYVGGENGKGRISLHSLATGVRLTQSARPLDCRKLCYSSWRVEC